MTTRRLAIAARLGACLVLAPILAAPDAEAQALKPLGKRALTSARVDPEECALAAAIAAEEDPSARAALMSKLMDMKSAKAIATPVTPSFESGGGGGGGY